MARFLGVLAGCVVLATAVTVALGTDKSSTNDREAVERAVLDYCEAFYEMKPELLKRSLHPELAKFGFHRTSADQEYRKIPSGFPQLLKLAEGWNKDGRFGKDAPKTVEVFDVLDKTAAAKLTAGWGIDYLHLAKYDGKWMIVQVIWQSYPVPPSKQGSSDSA